MPVFSFLRWSELLPEPMLLVSAADGSILAANGSVEKLGLDPATVRGRRLADLTVEGQVPIAEYLRHCSRSRQLLLGALTIRGAAGSASCRAEGAVFEPRAGDRPALLLLRLLPKETTAHPFLALKERIEVLNREIARRREAEEEVQKQREWLRVTVKSIGDAVIATDLACGVAFLNAAAEGLTGWPHEEAVGRPLDEVFHIFNEETRERTADPLGRVLREGVTINLANHTLLLTRGGREIPIEDSAAPIRDADGRILGAVLVFHDVSEQRSLRREVQERAARLVEADQRKDEFLAMLSHELRNPLAPISNALTILGLPGTSAADLQSAREMMSRQIRHLVRLVDDLLDVSRITQGKFHLQRERIDLAELTARAAESLRPLADAKGLDFAVDLPRAPILLDADPVRLEQVLFNLVHNAAKFTPAGGRLGLAVSIEDGEAVLRVRDTGAGMAADLLPRIFEPFVQADRSLDRSQGGLGLGLTLVRTLSEMHGGSASATSAGEGRGSEVTVRLPLPRQPEAEAAPPAHPDARPPSTWRVLVVDDNEDAALSIAILLGLWGHEVKTAFDGNAALAVAAGFAPEVVLLDLGLPGLDGYEVARRLRAGGLRGLLVAVTGYGREEDRARSRDAGFDRHLLKPVDLDALRAILESTERKSPERDL
jgi:PAS domain S-box-containing protein